MNYVLSAGLQEKSARIDSRQHRTTDFTKLLTILPSLENKLFLSSLTLAPSHQKQWSLKGLLILKPESSLIDLQWVVDLGVVAYLLSVFRQIINSLRIGIVPSLLYSRCLPHSSHADVYSFNKCFLRVSINIFWI